MRRQFVKPIQTAILALLTAWVVAASLPAGNAAASEPLKTTLSAREIRTLEKRLFAGVPHYPYSVPDSDLAAYVPDSFAMLAYDASTSNPSYISGFYRREMSRRGWSLLDSWASSKKSKTRQITLTFKKADRVISIDITRESGKAQYALFTYSESGTQTMTGYK